MPEPRVLIRQDSLSVELHCFREDNCAEHPDHDGPTCCCCGESAEAHTGCDCEDDQ